jgi:hypothetical protein
MDGVIAMRTASPFYPDVEIQNDNLSVNCIRRAVLEVAVITPHTASRDHTGGNSETGMIEHVKELNAE